MKQYVVHYVLPPGAFVQQGGPDPNKVSIGTGLLAINEFGRPVKTLVQEVGLTLDPDKWKSNPNGTLQFDQVIELPKGSDYLDITVWNITTRQLGSINVPIPDVKSVAQK